MLITFLLRQNEIQYSQATAALHRFPQGAIFPALPSNSVLNSLLAVITPMENKAHIKNTTNLFMAVID